MRIPQLDKPRPLFYHMTMKNIPGTAFKKPFIVKHLVAQIFFALAIFMLISTTGYTQSTVHHLPITLEYPLLRHLVVQAAFTEEGDRATLLDEEDGCARIVASDPQFSSTDDQLRSLTHVSLKLGKAFGNDCFLPIQWEGYLELVQKPKFVPETFTLAFETVASNLYTSDHKPARVSPFIWNRIRTDVHRHMEQIALDLAPPVDDLKTFLLPLFPPRNQQVAKTALDTIEPGTVVVGSDHIKAHVNIVLPVDTESEASTPETRLTQEEQARFIQNWERWDAFLVHIITQLAGQKLTLEDRQTLLETLLVTRHRFSDALNSVEQHRDFVRVQFTDVWQQLAPIFRKTLLRPNADGGLGYLTFFTASDALLALDAISPAMAIDISNDGLIRLARILDDAPLQYKPDMDVTLRLILGLPTHSMEPLQDLPEQSPNKSPPQKSESTIKPLSWLKSLISTVVWAKNVPSTQKPAYFSQWLPGLQKRSDYLTKVRMLLDRAATATHTRKKIPLDLYKFYIPLIQATAWQESCYRQFHVKKGSPTYLLSYNGTSVGLMQVNERVWRGIYDIERLRWDVAYNALAGNEIAALYLKRYVLKQIDNIDALDDNTVAGLVYAIYNGGPGHLKKYLARHGENKLYLTDRLFLQKWGWVLAKQWNKIDRCLGKAR